MKATIKNLTECTAQDVFDTVAEHLLTQKQKALDPDGRCVYRTEKGLKCAAGCLIPDDKDAEFYEGSSWIRLARDKKVPVLYKDLIGRLQRVHDMCPVEDWISELNDAAIRHQLKPVSAELVKSFYESQTQLK